MQRGVKRILVGITAGIAASVLAIILMSLGALDSWEAITFDIRAKTLARPGKATDDIRIILLDQKTLDWAKQEFGFGWPWPRQAYVPIVNFCRKADAKTLSFDVVFTEPSVYGVSDDKALGEAFRQFGKVILPADFARLDGSDDSWGRHAPKTTLTTSGTIRSGIANVATFPIPELTEGAAGIGNVNVTPDSDTVYRHVPLFVQFDKQLIPSLPLAAYFHGRKNNSLRFENDSVYIDNKPIQIARDGSATLNFRGPGGIYKLFSAAAILESGLRIAEGKAPLVDLTLFKGKHVFFGFSATGLYDLRPTPMGGLMPGVEINATTLDNLLSSDFMHRTSTMQDAWFTLFFAVLTGLSVLAFRQFSLSVFATSLSLLFPMAVAFILYRQGIWISITAPLSACITSLSITFGYRHATEGRQKRFIKSAFKQYLSPQVIDQILKHPERLRLGGERRELSIFFSDLQGFTTIAEGLAPEELTSVLNDYLSAMTDIIQGLGGTIDKYEGDAIIAFWNAPIDQPDHATRAVQAALLCQEKLTAMRPSLLKTTGKEFHMRIGVNTGQAVVGNLGSKTRFDYTMLGDAVNLAARLESLNKQFGTYTMISQSTLDQSAGYAYRKLSRVRVVGKREAITVYEPITEAAHTQRSIMLARFEEGLALFHSGQFAKAEAIFKGIESDDPAARRYATKCRKLQASPPDQWDGVWNMTAK